VILTIAYLLLIAAMLGLAAQLGERICVALDWPRRSVWLGALIASVALPAAAWISAALAPIPPSATPIMSLPPLFDQLPLLRDDAGPAAEGIAAVGAAASSAQAAWSFNWPDWRGFETTLIGLWIASSAVLLLSVWLAARRIHRTVRGAPSLKIGEQTVLLSNRYGPAVIGFLQPRIVLPHWLAGQHSALRMHVLEHERQHIAAQDQRVLLMAVLLVASMPWNLALWWQLRRLRNAIEFDCDRRVLRAGADPRAYSSALLVVGKQALRTPIAAVALIEPRSELERRIRAMLEQSRRVGRVGIVAGAVTAVSLLVAACAVNAPSLQPAPAIRPEVRLALDQSQTCMEMRLIAPLGERPDTDCKLHLQVAMQEIPDLTIQERAELLYMVASLSSTGGDTDGAIAANEAILDLPADELPSVRTQQALRGLISIYEREGRYQDAIDVYDRLLALPDRTPSEQDYYNRAVLHYQLRDFAAVLADTERAIASAERPREAAYELKYIAETLSGDADALNTFNELETRWPNLQRAGRAERLALAQSRIGDYWRGGVFRVTGDYLPAMRSDPIYPLRALARRLEGYVDLRYRVTTAGRTTDVVVVGSSSTLFDRSAIEAVQRFEYEQRIVAGAAVEVPEVTARIEYLVEDEG
jgi:TonB family protein